METRSQVAIQFSSQLKSGFVVIEDVEVLGELDESGMSKICTMLLKGEGAKERSENLVMKPGY